MKIATSSKLSNAKCVHQNEGSYSVVVETYKIIIVQSRWKFISPKYENIDWSPRAGIVSL